MESLKHLYSNLVTSLIILVQGKAELKSREEGTATSNRVSREVNHYRTHFFNL